MTLQEIGTKHKTDKAITHFYMDNYEKYLGEMRDREFVLLELGVAGMASINTWREFFPNAKVYGIDNNPDCAGEGIFIGDVTDEVFMQSVLDQIGEVLVLIEDSSHVGGDMIKIFQFIFPKLKSGGYFFLEDTHAGIYNPHYEQGSGAFGFFTRLAKDVDVAGRGMCGEPNFCINHPTTEPPVPEYSRILESIHIHTSLWLFKRR